MSDEGNTGGAGTNDGGANVDDNLSKSDRDYKADMLKFKDMLNESREQITDLQRKLEDRDIEVAKSEGDKDKVIQTLQQRLDQTSAELKGSKYDYARTNIESELKTRAIQKKCNDPDLLLKVIGDERIGKITVDGKYKPDIDEIDALLDETQKSTGHINLFGGNVKIADASPNNKPIETNNANKDVSQLSNDDLMAQLKSLPSEKRIADL